MSLNVLLVWWPLAVMATDWLAVAFSWRRLEYLAKPTAILAVLVWLLTYPRIVPNAPLPWYDNWFVAGLVFSLAGDVLLMLPERFFLGGLVAFLLAHVAYIVGLNSGGLSLPGEALMIVPVGLVGGWLAWRVGRALKASGREKLRAPVAVYAAVISLMLVSALSTLFEPGWPLGEAALVAVGAALFFGSDALLAWNRFVAPVRGARLLVIVAYHLGQMALIVGIAIHTLD
jgi:uncharacterized membrane protein YhhN